MTFVERRSGLRDRRHSPRGGRRSTDIAAAGLMVSAMLVVGCSTQETFSPLAPTSSVSDVRSDAAEPAPAQSKVEEITDDVGEENDSDADAPPETDIETDVEGDDEAGPEEGDDAAEAGALTVEPSKVTLTSGTTKQFVVENAKGTVRWQATGGTITSTGLYKAGSQAGTFTVTASTSRQGSKVAAVTVNVLATPPPPSPPPAPPAPPPTGGSGGEGDSSGGSTTPVTGTVISVGQSIQSAVNANPEGTTFVIKAGVHRRQSVKPKSRMTFIGEPGAVLDGEGATPREIGRASCRERV